MASTSSNSGLEEKCYLCTWTKLSPRNADRTALLRSCPFFEGSENPPTLYECKSLGVAQLRNSGWSKEQVQRLAGHRSVQMTEHYAKGHEAPFDEVGVGPQESPAHKRKRPESGPIRY